MHEEIRKFLEERFDLDFENDLDNETDLFGGGYVDSLESLVIINFIEKKYKIKISPDDLVENEFNSVNDIVEFIKMKG